MVLPGKTLEPAHFVHRLFQPAEPFHRGKLEPEADVMAAGAVEIPDLFDALAPVGHVSSSESSESAAMSSRSRALPAARFIATRSSRDMVERYRHPRLEAKAGKSLQGPFQVVMFHLENEVKVKGRAQISVEPDGDSAHH
jgi:hypothetical protein